MHGRSNMSRRPTPRKIVRQIKAPTTVPDSTPTDANRVDVGDWSLAQDENGALIIHNIMTGNRIIIARP